MTTTPKAVQAKAIQIGKLAAQATTAAGSGHPTTALSLAHLTAVLMYRVMRWDPAHPNAPGSDNTGRSPAERGHDVDPSRASPSRLVMLMSVILP